MALIKCNECNKEFSNFATACPQCGCPTTSPIKTEKGIALDYKEHAPTSKYIQEQLISGENVLFIAKIHWQLWIGPVIWSFFLGIFLLGAWASKSMGVSFFLLLILALVWGNALAKYLGTDLVITNKRVISKFGFIKRNSFELNLDKVEGVYLKQSILGRLFDCSSVIVRGVGSSSAPIPYIANYRIFKQILMLQTSKDHKN